MPVKPKTSQLIGIKALLRAINYRIVKGDSELLNDYFLNLRKAFSPKEVIKFLALIILTISALSLLVSTFVPKLIQKPNQINNMPIATLEVELFVLSELTKWSYTPLFKMSKPNNKVHELVFNIKKTGKFTFHIANRAHKNRYTFGLPKGSPPIPLNEIIPINNGPDARDMYFNVIKKGKYLIKLEFTAPDEFQLIVIKI